MLNRCAIWRWLENPALRIHERDALAAKLEAAREIREIEHAASKGSG
jgi:hypothetical protein